MRKYPVALIFIFAMGALITDNNCGGIKHGMVG